MKNYYELFRYSIAKGESYSSVDLSSLSARYDLIQKDIITKKSLAHVDSPEYAKLVDYENQLHEAYKVLSDEAKRAEYDASLVKPRGGKKGPTVRQRVISAVTGLVVAFTAFGATAAKPVRAKADTAIVVEAEMDASNFGEIYDDAYVLGLATKLVEELKEAGIINYITNQEYTVEEIFTLIKYSWGVYTPKSMEEIDVLHLNLLQLLISPINVPDYLTHILYAVGEDSVKGALNPNVKHVGFLEAFGNYKDNGAYPLALWFQTKRIEMFSATDRETINTIYREVGQAMADLMKGNGAHITVNGKEYTITSEQALANHAIALIITTEFQMVMANHYEYRPEKGEVQKVSQEWEVYNYLNVSGVDEDGKPIYVPDIVTYDEMNAWVNNGCDYEWAIEDVLVDGQTFGQRIQNDMEAMALNNYHMYNVSK